LLASLIERIDVGVDHIEIHFRPSRIGLLLDVAAPPLGAPEDEPQILVRVRLRRSGREISMLIDGADPFATVKPDPRLIKLLIRARRFNTTPVGGAGVPFAALAVSTPLSSRSKTTAMSAPAGRASWLFRSAGGAHRSLARRRS
jgi:hypothetical protein